MNNECQAQFTQEEIKAMLPSYYDLPNMISAEFATARDIAASLKDTLPPAAREWAEEEICSHMQRAQELATWNRFLHDALSHLDRTEQMILQCRFMGPKEPEIRKRGFRLASWKVVASLTDFSETTAKVIMSKSLKKMSQQPVPLVTFEPRDST